MRPLIMEFPGDTNVVNLSDEWMMGDSLLAAPILQQATNRSVYLPAGDWFVFGTNSRLKGERQIQATAGFDEIPVYVHAGSILPLAPVIQHTSQLPGGPLELQIYPGKDATFTLVEDDGETKDYLKGQIRHQLADRTLFFDFLPIEAMSIKGFKTKFQLYTVPGQVIYNTTRQLVLRGVDGIVFVADSQYEKMAENVESFANLEDNLKTLRLNLADIPYVLQYNKRDLPNVAPTEYMEFLLNNRDIQVPSFTATAHKCEGVFETLNMITRMLLHKFISQGTPQYA